MSMGWYVEMDGIAIAAVNSLNGVFSQIRAGDRLAAIKITGKDEAVLTLGTSSVPVTLATYADQAIAVYATSASTDTSHSAEAMYVKSTMTGIGGVGGRSRFHTLTNVALGDWCNGLKGVMEFGASGRITGLASAFCAELILSAGTTQGHYAALEAELIANSGVSTGTRTAFLYCNVAGSDSNGITTINTNGYFLVIGDGIEDVNDGIWEANDATATDFTHCLKCNINGTDMWIGLHTDKDFTD